MTDIQPTTQPPSNDSNTFAVLTWIGTLIFGFIPPLIVFLIKKDDAFVLDQSKEALNWSITAIIGYIACFVLTFVVIGVFLIPVLAILHLVFCILGAVNASKGVAYRLPFNIRLIK
ncbi:DUF4870 domain-containing protein [Chitiniphilus eburneus]|uniref:DUF4870 domain-containing protein n=1 Tax=Chitiniphilus eburneus TaxID=2571148 RepID=A0A4U0Q1I1_9NEIS|nr:DUF4870 domain-containing protein [Chitiniphilus eburneus]TJZ74807.1 DUF4870 domain-containing protein [Chitiniphilus eburneus]